MDEGFEGGEYSSLTWPRPPWSLLLDVERASEGTSEGLLSEDEKRVKLDFNDKMFRREGMIVVSG